MPEGTPSPYEQQAIEMIHAWRNPPQTWMSEARRKASAAWNDVTDLIHKVPGVDWTLDNIVAGLLDLTNEITQDSVWTEAVFGDYQKRGHAISSHVDVLDLDLEQVDAAIKGLGGKYVGLATTEGAATGLAGAAGIVPDIIALVSINLRAAGEYATYCGFDVAVPDERVYALQLLDHVAAPSNNTKNSAIAPAVRTASKAARQQTTQVLEQMGAGSAMEALARRLGINLTEKKLAQMVPLTGAVLGGGLNYFYTVKVCETARFLYRERFLAQKYGPDVLVLQESQGRGTKS